MRRICITAVAALIASGCATVPAEVRNADNGRAIVVADLTRPPPPGAVDIAKKDVKSDPGAGGDLAGAAAAGGMSAGGSIVAGLLANVLVNGPKTKTYDSRVRVFDVITEKDCKSKLAITSSDQVEISGLSPGSFAHWVDHRTRGGRALLSPLKGPGDKAVPKIDATHPCYAAFEAAVKEDAEYLASVKEQAEKQASAK
jgi:hypothetical protein